MKIKFKSLTINNIALAVNRRYGEYKLSQEKELWDILQAYIKASGSTGCCYSDYWQLYKYVLNNRPTEILECGTGVTTVILAYALKKNQKSGVTKDGRITSMENIKAYYEKAKDILPEELKDFVDMQLSEEKEYCYGYFRGVGYESVPDRDYDFVFIDGPGTSAPSDGHKSFNFDFLNVVKSSNKTVSGIIDKRLTTVFVMQKVFGKAKVKYNPRFRLGYIDSCSKDDFLSGKIIDPRCL